MHSKVFSDWLPSYIKATQPVLEIFKMAGYFPDRPRSWSENKFRELIAVKMIHTPLLNTTVVAFKVLPLGRYAAMPAPSLLFKTILKLVLWNGLQNSVVLLLMTSMPSKCLPLNISFIFGNRKKIIVG